MIRKIVLVILVCLLAFIVCLPTKCFAVDAETMIDVIECESSGRHTAVGDKGKSYGIAQFQKATFNEMKRAAKMPKLQYHNPIHQLRLMVWGMDHGYAARWSCYNKLMMKREKTYAMNNPLKLDYNLRSVNYRRNELLSSGRP